MVKYSPHAAKALAYLKSNYNDVDIFVEDTSNHNMWLSLIRKMLPAGMHLNSVNLLGGRDRVLAACRLDQSKTSRPKLYIVDGDFDFLLGRKKVTLRHLYRIRGYCIENLLIQEKAIVQLGISCLPNLTENRIAAKYNFQEWFDQISNSLMPLFAVYAVAHNLTPDIQTVGFSVTQLYLQRRDGPIICPIKTRKRIFQIARIIARKVGHKVFFKAYVDVKRKIRSCLSQQCISGKDYIFPLLLLRIRKVLGYKGTSDQLKVILASFWESTADPWFARRVRTLA